MAFENFSEQYKPNEVHQPSTVALLPSNHDYQNFFKSNQQSSTEPSFVDFGNSDIYGNHKKLLASDVKMPMPWEIESGLNNAVSETIVEPFAKAVGDKINQNRAEKDLQKIPEAAWSKAYSKFPELKKAGLTEKQAIMLMKAIVLNELEHLNLIDVAQDTAAGFGYAQAERTIGFTQLSPNAVKERGAEFPQQLGTLKKQEVQSLENPQKAPELVAATLVHYIKQFSKYGYPINEETLGYAYNPDLYTKSGLKDIMPTMERLQNSEHASNIRRWLSTFSQ